MEEYTIKEAAELLDVSTSTVRRRIKSNELKAEKKSSPYGKQYFIPASEIDVAAAENEIIELRKVNKNIQVDDLVDKILEESEKKNREIVDQAAGDIKDLINQQQKTINILSDQLEKMQQQQNEIKQRQNKSFIDKLKDLFK
jgi:excisionase family DNA binding protein